MKNSIRALFFAQVTFCNMTSAALGVDIISVNVNGKTYQCSEGGTAGFRFYCQCSSIPYDWILGYYKLNVETGEATIIRRVTNQGYIDQQACLAALNVEPLCK